MKIALVSFAGSACLLASTSLQASLNLVADPGFEGSESGTLTSTSTPWYNQNYTPPFTDTENVAINNSNPHTGANNAVLTAEVIDSAPQNAIIDQNITLPAMGTYAVSFWISTTGSGDLTVSLNGTYVTPGDAGVMGVNGNGQYAFETFNVTPANQSGILSFAWASSSLPLALDLDDVSITAVPEPTTMIAGALMLLPFAASTLRLRKKATA